MKSFNSLVQVLQSRSEGSKGIIFIKNKEDKFLSYSELYNKARKALKNLQIKGLKKGSELILLIDDNEEFLVLFWACLLGGIIPVPVGYNKENKLKVFQISKELNDPKLAIDCKTLSSIQKFLEECELTSFEDLLKNIVIDSEDILNIEMLEDSLGTIEELNSQDIAFIQFTSGTTGKSKGVILTHGNLLANTNAIIKGVNGSEEDSSLSWMPLYHDMGLIGFHLTPLTANTNQYLMPTSLFIRRPSIWLKKASEYKARTLACPNFGYKYFLTLFKPSAAKEWDLSNVRVIFNGAEYISTEICDEFIKAMEPYGLKNNVMFPVYGGAEGSLAMAFPPVGEGITNVSLHRKFLSIGDNIKEVDSNSSDAVTFVDEGYPVDECEIKICDSYNNELEENTVGFIHIKGKNVTKGYYNNPEKTENCLSEDGWLNTQDLGVFRNKRLIFIGRFDDAIYYNNRLYYPHYIQTLAEDIEEIELGKIAVCGVYNSDLRHHDVIAFVFYKKGMEEFNYVSEKLKELVKDKININISQVIPIKDMPKTTSGKIQRYKLIKRYLDGEYENVIEELRSCMN